MGKFKVEPQQTRGDAVATVAVSMHSQDDDRVCIHLHDSEGFISQHFYAPKRLVAQALADTNVPGLTYEAPARLPDENGLYIRKDLLDDLGRAVLIERRDDGWFYHRGGTARPDDFELRNLAEVGLLKISEVETK